MRAPAKIKLGPEENTEEEVITVHIKGEKVLVSPKEAVSIINQVSGVLLAYEHNKGSRE